MFLFVWHHSKRPPGLSIEWRWISQGKDVTAESIHKHTKTKNEHRPNPINLRRRLTTNLTSGLKCRFNRRLAAGVLLCCCGVASGHLFILEAQSVRRHSAQYWWWILKKTENLLLRTRTFGLAILIARCSENLLEIRPYFESFECLGAK